MKTELVASRRLILFAAVLAFFAVAALPVLLARPQNPDQLLPEQSAAKAGALLQQAIDSLGGRAYLGVRDSDCTARSGSFDTISGEAGGSIEVHILRMPPDKSRVEYLGHGFGMSDPLGIHEFRAQSVITNVYTADHLWEFDKDGVHELHGKEFQQYQDSFKTELNYILRARLNEPGMIFRYAGSDVVDLQQVDWVEVTDPERRTVRIAVDRNKHLPIRTLTFSRDPITGIRIEETTNYSNWHPLSGVQTPYRIQRERNGRIYSQTSIEGCRYNTGMSPALFTREGLEASRTSRKAKPVRR
jgi:hypothetical protein